MKLKNLLIFGAAVWSYFTAVNPGFAQGTAFSYQGRLNDSGGPANGSYDLRFTVYDAATNGNPVFTPVINSGTSVSNGLFTVTLDFGPGVFTGPDRWLEVAVRTNGPGAFNVLVPREPITPVPYAIMANSASNILGVLPATQLTSIGNDNGGFGNFFVGPSGNATMSGSENTAYGFQALPYNTNGSYNTAMGYGALFGNTSGNYNTAIGTDALNGNSSGSGNTGVGDFTLLLNTSGGNNTAVGESALLNNINGSSNTAVGLAALYGNTSGSGNIAIGPLAGNAIASGNNNIDIGNAGSGDESSTIRIGGTQTKTVIAGIYPTTLGGTAPLVCVNSSGQLGTGPSGAAALASDLQLEGGAAYHHLELSGGNSIGYLYGSYNKYGDGIHLGYNYYADAGGFNRLINSGGGTSRISVGYNSIILATGDVGAQPNFQNIVVGGTTVTVNGTLTVNGTFNNFSDRNAKQDFTPVSPSEILNEVARLPVSRWSYKADSGTRHIGPMAQDFYSSFNVGTDERHIAPIDEGGVALAAIQGLNEKLNEKDAQIKDLETRLEKLEGLMNLKNGGAK